MESVAIDFRKRILIVLLIGFLFRLFIIFCLPVRTFEQSLKRYHYAAVNLLEGRGYSHVDVPPYQPSLHKPPVYSIFLAIIYKIFGVNINAVKIIQALLDTTGCLLLFYLLRHYFNERLAFFGLVLAAFCPITAVYTNLVNPESLTLFFMILSLWLVSKSVRAGNPWFIFTAGISTILMSYCRPEFFSFVFIFGGYLFVRQMKKDLKKVLLYALGVLLVMTPWVVRNYSLTGKFIPLTTGAGIGMTLFQGTLGDVNNDTASFEKFLKDNPEIRRTYDEWYKVVLYNNSSVEDKTKQERIFMEMALRNIRKDPWKYVLSRTKRIPRVWINLHADEFAFLNTQNLRLLHPDFQRIIQYARGDPKEVFILGIKYLFFAVNIFYILMALKGLWAVRRELSTFSFIILPLVYAQIFFFFIFTSPSYTVPYWSCILFFSGIGFYFTFRKREKTEKLEGDGQGVIL